MNDTSPTPDVAAFQDAFNQRFILAQTFEEADLAELLVPFQWYEHQSRFLPFNYALRGTMSRMMALMTAAPDADFTQKMKWMSAGQFIQGLVQRGELSARPGEDPLDLVRDACRAAQKAIEGREGSVLDEVEQMKSFHEGWRGIVDDDYLDMSDRDAFAQLEASCAALVQAKQTVYNLIRRDGNRHLDAIAGFIHTLLAADQCYFLHALDAFPKDEGVLAFYDAFIAQSGIAHCKDEAARFRERVATGQEMTGFEL